MRELNINSIEVDGIDMRDYPDLVDTFVIYAEWNDGTPLTESEMNDIDPCVIYDRAINLIF